MEAQSVTITLLFNVIFLQLDWN